MLPNIDHPEAFGQHPNADITSQIQETRMMFDTLLSLQPQVSLTAGESREDKVCLSLLANKTQIPHPTPPSLLKSMHEGPNSSRTCCDILQAEIMLFLKVTI